MKELVEAGKIEALNSKEALIEAAKELGYQNEVIDKVLDDFDGFPLDDDALDQVVGGWVMPKPSRSLGKPVIL